MVCWVCGSLTSSNRLQDLRKPCPGHPEGINKCKAVERLNLGQPPRNIYAPGGAQMRAATERQDKAKCRRLDHKKMEQEARSTASSSTDQPAQAAAATAAASDDRTRGLATCGACRGLTACDFCRPRP